MIDLGGLSGGVPDGGTAGGASTTSGGGVDRAGVLDCDPCPGAGCTPQALATGTSADGPHGIALAGDGLYWVNRSGGTVMRLAATGGAPEALSTAMAPQAIATSGGYVVWGAQDGVYGCTAASCGATSVKIAASTMMGSIPSVAYDGAAVFYTDPGSGAVDQCPPLAACSAPIQLGNGYKMPTGLALYGTQVFWADQGDGNQDGDILSSMKGGGNPGDDQRLALPPHRRGRGRCLRLLHGVDGDGRQDPPLPLRPRLLQHARRSRHRPRRPARSRARRRAPLLDRLRRRQGAELPGHGLRRSAPKVHASGRTGLRRLAVGASCVFWTDDQGGGSVSKVAR